MPAPRGVVPGAPSVESRSQPATDVEYYLYPSRQDRKAGWPLTVTTPGLIFPTVHIQYAAIGPVRQKLGCLGLQRPSGDAPLPPQGIRVTDRPSGVRSA